MSEKQKTNYKFSCKRCHLSDRLSPEEAQDYCGRLGAKIRWCHKYDQPCQRVAWNCKLVSSRYGN